MMNVVGVIALFRFYRFPNPHLKGRPYGGDWPAAGQAWSIGTYFYPSTSRLLP